MLGHIRGNVMLLVLTLLVCCVLYPAVLWAIGQTLFHDQAQGSLIGPDGKPTSDEKKAVGSRLIAQAFGNDEHFQPRPSSGSYNAASSGGSNLAASNPTLRGRVAQLLGSIARYSKAYKEKHKKSDGGGPVVQDDIFAWFKEQTAPTQASKEKRDLFTEWATNNSTLAKAWATGNASIKDYILQWAKDHDDVVKDWKKDNPDVKTEPGADDLVVYFFKSYAKEHFGMWPTAEGPSDTKARIVAWAKDHPDVVKKWKAANPDVKDEPKDDDLVGFFFQDFATNPKDWPPLESGEMVDGDQKTFVKPDAQASDVQSTFFDTWLTERATVTKDLDPLTDLDQVPADLVTTSGSGLDPDVTLRGAQYQARRVIDAQVGLTTKALQKMLDDLAKDSAKPTPEAATKELEKITAELTGDDKTPGAVEKLVDDLLKEKASTPMFGLMGGEPLVNVLETNLALDARASDLEKKLEARLKAKASAP